MYVPARSTSLYPSRHSRSGAVLLTNRKERITSLTRRDQQNVYLRIYRTARQWESMQPSHAHITLSRRCALGGVV
jgi:hypothetical protein